MDDDDDDDDDELYTKNVDEGIYFCMKYITKEFKGFSSYLFPL